MGEGWTQEGSKPCSLTEGSRIKSVSHAVPRGIMRNAITTTDDAAAGDQKVTVAVSARTTMARIRQYKKVDAKRPSPKAAKTTT